MGKMMTTWSFKPNLPFVEYPSAVFALKVSFWNTVSFGLGCDIYLSAFSAGNLWCLSLCWALDTPWERFFNVCLWVSSLGIFFPKALGKRGKVDYPRTEKQNWGLKVSLFCSRPPPIYLSGSGGLKLNHPRFFSEHLYHVHLLLVNCAHWLF